MIKTMQNLPDEIINVIVGDGVQKEQLMTLVKSLDLENRVFFIKSS